MMAVAAPLVRLAACVSLVLATAATAQNIDAPKGYADLKALPVPVVEGDITDRPYRVILRIDADIRKNGAFGKMVSREKIHRELWERAAKVGADAVVNATYGESRITAWSWGARAVSGDAVKFLTDAEIADRAALSPEE